MIWGQFLAHSVERSCRIIIPDHVYYYHMIDSRSLRIALLSLLVLGPPLLSFNLNHTGHIVRNGSLHTCIPNWRSNMCWNQVGPAYCQIPPLWSALAYPRYLGLASSYIEKRSPSLLSGYGPFCARTLTGFRVSL